MDDPARISIRAAALATALLPALVAAGAAAEAPAAGLPPLRVVAFYSSTCRHCYEAKKALADSAERWGGRVTIEHRDVKELANFREMFRYEDRYGCKSQSPPKVFVGGQYLEGYQAIGSRLQGVIAEELAKGAVTYLPPPARNVRQDGKLPADVLDRFSGFSIGAVAAAGLLDGVNPCAFTTIVFLLSMLAYLGRSRRQLAVVGIGFTAAVFVTYFLLGLGLLQAIKVFSVTSGVSTALACAVAALAIGLAVWSFVDFVRYARSGDVKKVTLGLPKVVKTRIHSVIRRGLKTRGLLAGSLAVGALVALLESLCTGQVYLPTIVFVARAPHLRPRAIGYLLFYNLMFVAPLVAIMGVAYFGVSSERLGLFLRRHLAGLKLAMSLLFAALGAFILATL